MSILKTHSASLILLSTLIFISNNLSANIINGNQWLIKPGDSLYKIARHIFPGDSKQQANLRKSLIEKNPQVFKNGANNISVGDKLLLPSFAITEKQTIKTPVKKQPVITKPVVQKSIEPEPEPQPVEEIVTVDPQDIIGQVVVNVGQLSATNRGTNRRLNRRSPIFKGDTISTGNRSLTQIRLKDGALLSLRPYTDIKIADYNYNGQEDGTERSLIELLKGGFRTITGAIGHKNKQNYRVRTTVATIGIRGTHYSLVLCQQQSCNGKEAGEVDDGLYGGVADGSIVIENQSGTHTFNNDQFFKLTSATTAPVETLIPPAILKTGAVKIVNNAPTENTNPDNPEQQQTQTQNRRSISQQIRNHAKPPAIIFQTDNPVIAKVPQTIVRDLNTPQIAQANNTAAQPTQAPNGSAMLIGFNHTDQLDASITTGVSAPILITANNNNELFLTSQQLPNGTTASRIPFAGREFELDPDLGTIIEHQFVMASLDGEKATLVPSSVGGNGNFGVNWGRWRGDFTIFENGQQMQTRKDFHFIYSENLTTQSQLANLGGLGANVNYTVAGGTRATDANGNVAADVANIFMNVDFISRQITNYDVSTQVNGVDYSASNVAAVPFQELNQSFDIQSISVGCSSSCAGEASVVFVGNQAQGAMTSYHIEDTSGSNDAATGAALLINQSAPVAKP